MDTGYAAPRIRWASIGRLALAHHPRCYPFRHDVYRVAGVELCVGCFTAYPIAAATLVALASLPALAWWVVVAMGVFLGSAQALAIGGWTATRSRKIMVKVALGLGLGAVVFGVMAAPWTFAVRLLALAAGLVLAALAMAPRAIRMRRTCEGCFFQGDWERCTGMALLRPPSLPGDLDARRHPVVRPAAS